MKNKKGHVLVSVSQRTAGSFFLGHFKDGDENEYVQRVSLDTWIFFEHERRSGKHLSKEDIRFLYHETFGRKPDKTDLATRLEDLVKKGELKYDGKGGTYFKKD